MSRSPVVLSVLIVTYNSAGTLSECLDSLASNSPGCTYEVIAVDNGSTDATVNMLDERADLVSRVENNTNLGFAGGNMLAAGHASGELLLLLNPDTIVLPGAIDALIEALHSREDAWVAGACLLTKEGAFNATWGDLPDAAWALTVIAPWRRLGLRPCARRRMGVGCEGMILPTTVGWVSGAAFLVPRSAWDTLHGLDTGYFMYFEETDFCRRVHEAGHDVIVVPQARIVHLEGASVGQASARQRVWFTESLIRFLSRAYGPGSALVVRSCVVAVNAILVAASYPVGLFSRRVSDARPRYAALVRVGLGAPVSFDERGVPR